MNTFSVCLSITSVVSRTSPTRRRTTTARRRASFGVGNYDLLSSSPTHQVSDLDGASSHRSSVMSVVSTSSLSSGCASVLSAHLSRRAAAPAGAFPSRLNGCEPRPSRRTRPPTRAVGCHPRCPVPQRSTAMRKRPGAGERRRLSRLQQRSDDRQRASRHRRLSSAR